MSQIWVVFRPSVKNGEGLKPSHPENRGPWEITRIYFWPAPLVTGLHSQN